MRYDRPQTIADAAAALAAGDARALAGGTDLLVRLGREQGWPAGLVDLKSLPELQGIEVREDALSVGAAAPLADLHAHPALAAWPLPARQLSRN